MKKASEKPVSDGNRPLDCDLRTAIKAGRRGRITNDLRAGRQQPGYLNYNKPLMVFNRTVIVTNKLYSDITYIK